MMKSPFQMLSPQGHGFGPYGGMGFGSPMTGAFGAGMGMGAGFGGLGGGYGGLGGLGGLGGFGGLGGMGGYGLGGLGAYGGYGGYGGYGAGGFGGNPYGYPGMGNPLLGGLSYPPAYSGGAYQDPYARLSVGANQNLNQLLAGYRNQQQQQQQQQSPQQLQQQSPQQLQQQQLQLQQQQLQQQPQQRHQIPQQQVPQSPQQLGYGYAYPQQMMVARPNQYQQNQFVATPIQVPKQPSLAQNYFRQQGAEAQSVILSHNLPQFPDHPVQNTQQSPEQVPAAYESTNSEDKNEPGPSLHILQQPGAQTYAQPPTGLSPGYNYGIYGQAPVYGQVNAPSIPVPTSQLQTGQYSPNQNIPDEDSAQSPTQQSPVAQTLKLPRDASPSFFEKSAQNAPQPFGIKPQVISPEKIVPTQEPHPQSFDSEIPALFEDDENHEERPEHIIEPGQNEDENKEEAAGEAPENLHEDEKKPERWISPIEVSKEAVKREADEVFSIFDKENKGVLEVPQFYEALSELMNRLESPIPSEEEVLFITGSFEKNPSNGFSSKDFKKAAKELFGHKSSKSENWRFV
eukprot:TRINITY_DN1352_c0_g2_i1.p1 TRINITY_DN1352_c0_g2~~TRINITY_DN1352_c0_g2_i1.p1  ORF type:complete len:569 (-),score=149.13 TRINITY_DN1352_c0_g2_i1:132-1838(-)